MSQKSITVSVAGHITSFFYANSKKGEDLLQKGSSGAGFNIKKGVMTKVTIGSSLKNEIYFNSKKQIFGSAKVSESVLEIFTENIGINIPNFRIQHEFQVPGMAGFGTSASGALGLVFCLKNLLEIDITDLEMWQIAHKSEILNTSGLGDILGLYSNSEFELRIKPGSPGIGKVIPISFDTTQYELFTLSKGNFSTKAILLDENLSNQIREYGIQALKSLKKNLNFETFLEESFVFTEKLNLLDTKLKKLLVKIDKEYPASQIMLGNSIFVFVPKSKLNRFRKEYSQLGFENQELTNKSVFIKK